MPCQLKPENDGSELQEDDSGRKTTSRVSRSFKAVRVDWFDRFIETYSLRHRRHGHLFQNHYKAIVCEEDTYFRELIRYIHLNPLQANLVRNLSELDRYLWCGHSILMGKIKNDWQDRDYVLKWFGSKEGEAKKAYHTYVQKGIGQGRHPELIGGGLIRSLGGWSQVKSMRRAGDRELSDQRI